MRWPISRAGEPRVTHAMHTWIMQQDWTYVGHRCAPDSLAPPSFTWIEINQSGDDLWAKKLEKTARIQLYKGDTSRGFYTSTDLTTSEKSSGWQLRSEPPQQRSKQAVLLLLLLEAQRLPASPQHNRVVAASPQHGSAPPPPPPPPA